MQLGRDYKKTKSERLRVPPWRQGLPGKAKPLPQSLFRKAAATRIKLLKKKQGKAYQRPPSRSPTQRERQLQKEGEDGVEEVRDDDKDTGASEASDEDKDTQSSIYESSKQNRAEERPVDTGAVENRLETYRADYQEGSDEERSNATDLEAMVSSPERSRSLHWRRTVTHSESTTRHLLAAGAVKPFAAPKPSAKLRRRAIHHKAMPKEGKKVVVIDDPDKDINNFTTADVSRKNRM